MNSDQLLRNLDDCAQASTHEPDAETINAAIARIRELEAQLAAAREALKEFDTSKWTLTNGDGLIAYQKLFEALVK